MNYIINLIKKLNFKIFYFLKYILLNGEKAYTGKGIMINSDKFNGMNSEKAKEEIEELLNKRNK